MPRPGTKIFGYSMRAPSESELQFFSSKPDVSGYAAEDGAIVLNPYTRLTETEQYAVAKNEAARLLLRELKPSLNFALTPEQVQKFAGTSYAGQESAQRETLLGRIISGDPSVGQVTPEQQQWADWLARKLQERQTR